MPRYKLTSGRENGALAGKLTLVNLVEHGCKDKQRLLSDHGVRLRRIKSAVVARKVIQVSRVVAPVEVVGGGTRPDDRRVLDAK